MNVKQYGCILYFILEKAIESVFSILLVTKAEFVKGPILVCKDTKFSLQGGSQQKHEDSSTEISKENLKILPNATSFISSKRDYQEVRGNVRAWLQNILEANYMSKAVSTSQNLRLLGPRATGPAP